MTYAAKKEYCSCCGGWHPRYLLGCPKNPDKEEWLSDPPVQLQFGFEGAPVDKTTNVRGSYHTLYFNCPKCSNTFVLLNSNYCSHCGIKLNWK